MSKTVRIAVWVAFSAGFALLPLFINFLMLRIEGKRLDWHDLSSHGELFLVAAAISADALGRLWLSGLRSNWRVSLCFIGCLSGLLCSSVEFSLVASRLQASVAYDGVAVARDALTWFLVAFSSSLGVMLCVEA
jgi:hypothetical protein